jgi:hypothetical protein
MLACVIDNSIGMKEISLVFSYISQSDEKKAMKMTLLTW